VEQPAVSFRWVNPIPSVESIAPQAPCCNRSLDRQGIQANEFPGGTQGRIERVELELVVELEIDQAIELEFEEPLEICAKTSW